MGEISRRVESTGSCEINLRSRRLGLERRLKGVAACCTCAHRILVILRAVQVFKQMVAIVVLLGKYEVCEVLFVFCAIGGHDVKRRKTPCGVRTEGCRFSTPCRW